MSLRDYDRERRIYARTDAEVMARLRDRLQNKDFDQQALTEAIVDLEHVEKLAEFDAIKKRACARLTQIAAELERPAGRMGP